MIQQIHSLILSFGQFNSFHLSSVLCRSWELEESSAIRFSRRAKMALAERDGAPGWHSLPRDTPTTSHASDAPSDFPLVHAKPSPVPLCYNLSYLCHVWQKKKQKNTNTPAILCQSQFILSHKSFQWGQPVHHVPSHDALLYICLRVGALLINRLMHTATVGVADLMG